jgi:DNA-directed RNA polymerase beta subunit
MIWRSRSLPNQQKIGSEYGPGCCVSLTKEDIILIIKYLIELINSKADVDDIDHLSNRRVRTVGEQLYAQFGVVWHVWLVPFVSV